MERKTRAIAGASPAAIGAVLAQMHLRQVLGILGVLREDHGVHAIMSIRRVKRIIESKLTIEGAGVKLRRAFAASPARPATMPLGKSCVTSSASASPGFDSASMNPRESSSRMSSTRLYVEMVASAVFGESRKTSDTILRIGSSRSRRAKPIGSRLMIMLSGMPSIAAGSEPRRHLRSAPGADLMRRLG